MLELNLDEVRTLSVGVTTVGERVGDGREEGDEGMAGVGGGSLATDGT